MIEHECADTCWRTCMRCGDHCLVHGMFRIAIQGINRSEASGGVICPSCAESLPWLGVS